MQLDCRCVMSAHRCSAALAAVLLLLPLRLTRAWTPEGHERIARVAQGLLPGKHSDQIRTMMHSDVIDAAGWEKTMTSKFPETDPLHWHRQNPEWTCDQRGGLGDKGGHVRCDNHGAENGSLFCALAYFFEHFTHDALLKEYPQPKEPIGTPADLPVLKKIPSSEQTPAHFLRWLAILVGDLHQPLHWLHEYNYGKDIIVRYKGEEHNLLSFWEDYIPNHLKKEKQTMHPDMTDKEYGDRSKKWGHKVPTELFREWAKDSAEKLCTEVYAPMTVNHADGTRVESPFDLTEELFVKWSKLAQDMLALGGERLAFVLNDLIEHKRHKEAQKLGRALPSVKLATGTEVIPAGASVPATVVGPGTAGSVVPTDPTSADKPDMPVDFAPLAKKLMMMERRRSRTEAFYNLCIAVILVPSLLAVFNWHRGVGGGSILGLAKHLKM